MLLEILPSLQSNFTLRKLLLCGWGTSNRFLQSVCLRGQTFFFRSWMPAVRVRHIFCPFFSRIWLKALGPRLHPPLRHCSNFCSALGPPIATPKVLPITENIRFRRCCSPTSSISKTANGYAFSSIRSYFERVRKEPSLREPWQCASAVACGSCSPLQ